MQASLSPAPALQVSGWFNVEAPITPSGTPSSSITSEMRLVHSPSARKRSAAPGGGFGVEVIRIRSAAIRPVSFFPLFSTRPSRRFSRGGYSRFESPPTSVPSRP